MNSFIYWGTFFCSSFFYTLFMSTTFDPFPFGAHPALHGGYPQKNWNKIQPIAYTSHLSVYSLFLICWGEAYYRVHTDVGGLLLVWSKTAPKSLIFISPFPLTRIFWGLRSLWNIFFRYRDPYALRSSCKFFKAYSGVSYPFPGMLSCPFSMSSQAITNILLDSLLYSLRWMTFVM